MSAIATISLMTTEHLPVLAPQLLELLAPEPGETAVDCTVGGACVVVGGGEYLEIWSAEAWARQEQELDAEAPEIAEGLAGTAE